MTDSPPSSSDPSSSRDAANGDRDQLPIPSDQNTSLLHSPPTPVKVIIERGASAYFSTCRRLAAILNRDD